MNGTVLFDIDNTLLYTGGAGTAALNRAFAETYGIENAFAQVEFHGRTDFTIVKDALRIHGLLQDGDTCDITAFVDTYLRHLDITLVEREGHLKPGIPLLLDALLAEGLGLGLATGNLRVAAARKLQYFGIDSYFTQGGFGDFAGDRASMVKEAVIACDASGEGCTVFVVGDTPGDVVGGKTNGALAIGVATGAYTLDELAEAGADLVLPDLGDVGRVVGELRVLATARPASPRARSI